MELRRAYPNELCHYGIKGQHWGERRFQNENGTLTEAGKQRYGKAGTVGRKKKIGMDKETGTLHINKYGAVSTHRRGEGLGTGKVGSGPSRTEGANGGGGGQQVENPFNDADKMLDALTNLLKEGHTHEEAELPFDCTAKYVLNSKGKPVLEVRDSDGLIIGRLDPETASDKSLEKLVKDNHRVSSTAFRQRRKRIEESRSSERDLRRSGR